MRRSCTRNHFRSRFPGVPEVEKFELSDLGASGDNMVVVQDDSSESHLFLRPIQKVEFESFYNQWASDAQNIATFEMCEYHPLTKMATKRNE